MKKVAIDRLFYVVRNLRSRRLFEALAGRDLGDVLDVGGGDFALSLPKHRIDYKKWITVERDIDRIPDVNAERVSWLCGDGCHLPFADGSFDTILNIQTLEHVFEPIKMVSEIARVLKPGGQGIFLIPQTGNIHLAPHHYYNFTKYWIREVMKMTGMRILKLEPLGGAWSTFASRFVFFFCQSFRYPTMSSKEDRRSLFFYLLYPLMALYAVLSIPLCLIFSTADMTEEPNNHLVITQKNPN